MSLRHLRPTGNRVLRRCHRCNMIVPLHLKLKISWPTQQLAFIFIDLISHPRVRFVLFIINSAILSSRRLSDRQSSCLCVVVFFFLGKFNISRVLLSSTGMNSRTNVPYEQLPESGFIVLLYFFLRLITEWSSRYLTLSWPSTRTS